ncbi:7640_t:CDS:2 [Ambispora leptoticha]|uniref:26S proteasome complex subunit SEM1 n=1 Tax=Ambispora leptoticha TaxID=144679 RepID=A0A9N9FPP3_9GLOM|nr:7640_t:CDS:2 [Ambispora leptoticha]
MGNTSDNINEQQGVTTERRRRNTETIPQLGALEEDDEFEEFAAEDWNETEDDKETQLWEDNWDDEDVEDDFSTQLRAELTKAQSQPQPMKM